MEKEVKLPNSSGAAFMSYARDDDRYDSRLTQFRHALEVSFRLRVSNFAVFQDRDIEWGDSWSSRIEQQLATADFLIPIVTPSFFRSEYCRAEVETFIERERSQGREDLILPIYWIDTDELADPEFRGGMAWIESLATRQLSDWRELSNYNFDTPEVRSGLADLANTVRRRLRGSSFDEERINVALPRKVDIDPLLLGHLDPITALSFASSGHLISGDARGNVRIWDIASGSSESLPSRNEVVIGIGLDDQSGTVVAAFQDGHLTSWSLESRESISEEWVYCNFASFTCNSNLGLFATSDSQRKLQFWRIAPNLRTLQMFDALDDSRFLPHPMALDPTGRSLATGRIGHGSSTLKQMENRLSDTRIYDAQSGELVSTLAGATYIYGISYSRDGHLLAVLTGGELQIWRTEDWTVLRQFQASGPVRSFGSTRPRAYPTFTPSALCFDTTGRYVVTASKDSKVAIFDVQTGETVTTYDDPAGPPTTLAMSRSGGYLAVAAGANVRIRSLSQLKSRSGRPLII